MAAKECPVCNKLYKDEVNFCPADGEKLEFTDRVLEKDIIADFTEMPLDYKLYVEGEQLPVRIVNLVKDEPLHVSIGADGKRNCNVTFLNAGDSVLKFNIDLPEKSPEERRKVLVASISSQRDMDMQKIPAGNYVLGSNRANHDERPTRTVYTEGFYIDKCEVTMAQYERFLKDIKEHGHKWCHPDEPENKDHTPTHTYAWAQRFSWNNGIPPRGKEDHPVVLVDWYDAYAYASWAGKRLPTENEWEIAARGNDLREYPWGNTFDKAKCHIGNAPTAVGKYPEGASPFGVLDLAGNVAEWTATAYEERASNAKLFGGKYGMPIIKGGSWDDTSRGCRSSARDIRRSPFYKSTTVGFRCVK